MFHVSLTVLMFLSRVIIFKYIDSYMSLHYSISCFWSSVKLPNKTRHFIEAFNVSNISCPSAVVLERMTNMPHLTVDKNAYISELASWRIISKHCRITRLVAKAKVAKNFYWSEKIFCSLFIVLFLIFLLDHLLFNTIHGVIKDWHLSHRLVKVI